MSNPFAGIITPEFKALFNNAIDALLESTALTVPCRIVFGTTKNTECPNCILDTNARVSANKYKVGGPSSFPLGSICPMCAGVGFIAVDTSQIIYMAVIYNEQRSKFIKTGLNLTASDYFVQTISHASTYAALKNAKEVVFDTAVEGQATRNFQRYGDPTPVGFGDSAYIITLWTIDK